MNRVWLITGASSGFGRAITDAAVAADDTVIATARNAAVLSGTAAAHPGQVEALALDVTDTAAIEAAVQDVTARHGRIDVLVNNAGRGHVGAAEETSDADLRSLFDVHVFGPAALTRAVLPQMREHRSGAIVQMSSTPGTPLRLPLGDDAVDAISGHLDGIRAELTAWEKTARDTHLDTLA